MTVTFIVELLLLHRRRRNSFDYRYITIKSFVSIMAERTELPLYYLGSRKHDHYIWI